MTTNEEDQFVDRLNDKLATSISHYTGIPKDIILGKIPENTEVKLQINVDDTIIKRE